MSSQGGASSEKLFLEVADNGAIRNECLLGDPAPAQGPKFEKLNHAPKCVDLDATVEPSEKPAAESKIEKAVEIESESDSPDVIELPIAKLNGRKLIPVGRFAHLNFRGRVPDAGVAVAAWIPEGPCSTQVDRESSGTGS